MEALKQNPMHIPMFKLFDLFWDTQPVNAFMLASVLGKILKGSSSSLLYLHVRYEKAICSGHLMRFTCSYFLMLGLFSPGLPSAFYLSIERVRRFPQIIAWSQEEFTDGCTVSDSVYSWYMFHCIRLGFYPESLRFLRLLFPSRYPFPSPIPNRLQNPDRNRFFPGW